MRLLFSLLQKRCHFAKEPARNKLVSWFSNFVSWQGATNAHSLSSVIEERRRQGAKGQTKWVSYFLPAPNSLATIAIACRQTPWVRGVIP